MSDTAEQTAAPEQDLADAPIEDVIAYIQAQAAQVADPEQEEVAAEPAEVEEKAAEPPEPEPEPKAEDEKSPRFQRLMRREQQLLEKERALEARIKAAEDRAKAAEERIAKFAEKKNNPAAVLEEYGYTDPAEAAADLWYADLEKNAPEKITPEMRSRMEARRAARLQNETVAQLRARLDAMEAKEAQRAQEAEIEAYRTRYFGELEAHAASTDLPYLKNYMVHNKAKAVQDLRQAAEIMATQRMQQGINEAPTYDEVSRALDAHLGSLAAALGYAQTPAPQAKSKAPSATITNSIEHNRQPPPQEDEMDDEVLRARALAQLKAGWVG